MLGLQLQHSVHNTDKQKGATSHVWVENKAHLSLLIEEWNGNAWNNGTWIYYTDNADQKHNSKAQLQTMPENANLSMPESLK